MSDADPGFRVTISSCSFSNWSPATRSTPLATGRPSRGRPPAAAVRAVLAAWPHPRRSLGAVSTHARGPASLSRHRWPWAARPERASVRRSRPSGGTSCPSPPAVRGVPAVAPNSATRLATPSAPLRSRAGRRPVSVEALHSNSTSSSGSWQSAPGARMVVRRMEVGSDAIVAAGWSVDNLPCRGPAVPRTAMAWGRRRARNRRPVLGRPSARR
ncbi:hypothetical protein Franean1_2696 [Parafrankia sp. EAN1pec]|nr:hypothetical protein Franean1_2696 [Frankia sp. EAN1pec]